MARLLINSRRPTGFGRYGKRNVREQQQMWDEIRALRRLVHDGQDAYVEALHYLIRATDGDIESARDYLDAIR